MVDRWESVREDLEKDDVGNRLLRIEFDIDRKLSGDFQGDVTRVERNKIGSWVASVRETTSMMEGYRQAFENNSSRHPVQDMKNAQMEIISRVIIPYQEIRNNLEVYRTWEDVFNPQNYFDPLQMPNEDPIQHLSDDMDEETKDVILTLQNEYDDFDRKDLTNLISAYHETLEAYRANCGEPFYFTDYGSQ